MNRACFALLLALLKVFPSHAQGQAKDAAAAQQLKKVVQDGASGATPLPTTVNVDTSVNIEAVMLPSSIVQRVFGKEVAGKYAVIEVNISNRSNDAGFILQSLFIDYSHWALAQPLSAGGISRNGKSHQSRASTHDVSSVEYRIVRGEMLDAQPWTQRNSWFRGIKVLGSIGTAFAFPFSRDVVTGIGAWNGAVVPGFEQFFPDGMEGQLNRVSDYGFRNDKVIPQQSADIVVAFFPIDRFLSPSLRKIFLDTPAVFFNPYLMAIDPKTSKQLGPILRNAMGSPEAVKTQLQGLTGLIAKLDVDEIAAARERVEEKQESIAKDNKLQADLQDKLATPLDPTARANTNLALTGITNKLVQDATELSVAQKNLNDQTAPLKANGLYNFLSQISLSKINIVVSGIMTVDELTIPPSIESTCFDNAGPDLWALYGKKSCFIKGRFLSNGTPKVLSVDPADPGISNIVVDKDGSTSELLKFSFDLQKPLDSATVDVVVTKEGKNGTSLDSMKYRISSGYTLPGPMIETVTNDATGGATVMGSGFYSNPKNPFGLFLRMPGATESRDDLKIGSDAPADANKITLDSTTLAKANPGCYQLVVDVGTRSVVSKSDQLVRVDPSITSAKHSDGTTVQITGTKFVSTSSCGGAEPTFEFLDANDKVLGSAKTLANATANVGSTTLTFDLTTDAATAVKVRLKGKKDATSIN
jgi:hypothetical protein